MKTSVKAGKKLLTVPARIAAGAVLFIPGLIFEKTGHPVPAFVLCLLSMLVCGADVVINAFRGIFRGDMLDEKFLMTVAAAGAFILGDYSEAAAVMLFYQIGEYFQTLAVRRSRDAIKSLTDICPDEATLVVDGEERRVSADDLEPGQTIVVRSGERVPADCVVTSGSADIDMSALNGESQPRAAVEGEELESGAVVMSGALFCRVLRAASESTAARILELVENASEKKAKEENFITAFSRIYTPVVVGIALLVAVIPPIFKLLTFAESIRRALVFLVVSCPCALLLSVPLAFFGGIGGAASRGILFKGGSSFRPVARADVFVFDKTGTLTDGRLRIMSTDGPNDKEQLLYYAASAEYPSNHPAALCIKAACPNPSVPTECREIPGRGCVSVVDGKKVCVGNAALISNECGKDAFDASGLEGDVFVSVDGEPFGGITFADALRPEAKAAVAGLHSLGIKRTVILSGDSRKKAEFVREELGITEAEAELMPAGKFERLTEIMKNSRSTVFVGDGVNDAPSIAGADAGVAMGGVGQDSAIEAADLVIVSDNLEKLPEAVRAARKTVRIATENIIFALAVKLCVLLLGALGFCGMWAAVFADVGVAVICVLNSIRTMRK